MIRIGREIQCLPYAGFFYKVNKNLHPSLLILFGRVENIFFLTNERPGIWSCDLWANERPRKKSHGKGTYT